MSQTANAQFVRLVLHPEPALPVNISARRGLCGSSQRKNSCVLTSNWFSSRGVRASRRPPMS
jgi:hypothetical protein